MKTKIIPCDDKFRCPYCGHYEGHRAGDYSVETDFGTGLECVDTCDSCSGAFKVSYNGNETVTLTFDETLVKPKTIEVTEQFCKDFRELITAQTEITIKEYLGRDTFGEAVRFNKLENEFDKKYFSGSEG